MKDLGSLEYIMPTSLQFFMRYCYFDSHGSFAYKKILSMPGWWFIRLSNAIRFPDSECPTISIQYKW